MVDRDALLQCNNLELLWETDDEIYDDAKPFGKNIRPLQRWELENYLLDPQELENTLADSSKETSWKARDKQIITDELLKHCDVLVPVMAANVLLHGTQNRSLDFGFSLNLKNRDETETVVQEQLSKKLGPNSSWSGTYYQCINKIEAFGEKYSTVSDERWDRLNRIIDGKRILKRIQHQYCLNEKMIYRLARGIKRENRIDPELIKMIQKLKAFYDEKEGDTGQTGTKQSPSSLF